MPLATAQVRQGVADALRASAALGRRVATLLDSETAVAGVTGGTIDKSMREVAVFRRLDDKPARPEAGDLDVTAGWGHLGKSGATMPGRGKLKPSVIATPHDSESETGKFLTAAFDIFLNDVACWRNVPEAVWNYTIGGYQVVKKWLSYREKRVLGRGLTPEEVRRVTDTCRRLAALINMQTELDDNYYAMLKKYEGD